jgi:hypothetical protein
VTGVDEPAILETARALGREIVARHDPGFEVGKRLLAGVRAGWLDAARADVGAERKLRL